MQGLSISCVFSCMKNTASFRYSFDTWGLLKVKSSYNKSAYYSMCDDYDVNAEEIWMHGECFYTVEDGHHKSHQHKSH